MTEEHAMVRGKRKTEQDYYALATKCGIVWLGPEVPNIKTKTWWQCSQGHRCQIRYNDVQQGHICPICGAKQRRDWERKTPADYRVLAEERGYKWLGPFPNDIKGRTWWECEQGHHWQARYNCIQQGRGCPKCGKIAMAKKSRHPIPDYRILAQQRGYEWLGPESFRALDKTWWECEKGHHWEARYNSIQQGQGCPICAGVIPKVAADYQELAAVRGLEWVRQDVPQTTKAKTLWRCSRGHRWETCYSDIQQGYGCPQCHNERRSELSKAMWARGIYDGAFQSPTSIELKVAAALDICGIEHIPQYRPDGYSRIYDEFVSPDVLIEVHGDYWHGSEKPETQRRDVEKATWAEENGYHLVVMWEHEIKEQGAWSLVYERVLPLLDGQNNVSRLMQ